MNISEEQLRELIEVLKKLRRQAEIYPSEYIEIKNHYTLNKEMSKEAERKSKIISIFEECINKYGKNSIQFVSICKCGIGIEYPIEYVKEHRKKIRNIPPAYDISIRGECLNDEVSTYLDEVLTGKREPGKNVKKMLEIVKRRKELYFQLNHDRFGLLTNGTATRFKNSDIDITDIIGIVVRNRNYCPPKNILTRLDAIRLDVNFDKIIYDEDGYLISYEDAYEDTIWCTIDYTQQSKGVLGGYHEIPGKECKISRGVYLPDPQIQSDSKIIYEYFRFINDGLPTIVTRDQWRWIRMIVDSGKMKTHIVVSTDMEKYSDNLNRWLSLQVYKFLGIIEEDEIDELDRLFGADFWDMDLNIPLKNSDSLKQGQYSIYDLMSTVNDFIQANIFDYMDLDLYFELDELIGEMPMNDNFDESKLEYEDDESYIVMDDLMNSARIYKYNFDYEYWKYYWNEFTIKIFPKEGKVYRKVIASNGGALGDDTGDAIEYNEDTKNLNIIEVFQDFYGFFRVPINKTKTSVSILGKSGTKDGCIDFVKRTITVDGVIPYISANAISKNNFDDVVMEYFRLIDEGFLELADTFLKSLLEDYDYNIISNLHRINGGRNTGPITYLDMALFVKKFTKIRKMSRKSSDIRIEKQLRFIKSQVGYLCDTRLIGWLANYDDFITGTMGLDSVFDENFNVVFDEDKEKLDNIIIASIVQYNRYGCDLDFNPRNYIGYTWDQVKDEPWMNYIVSLVRQGEAEVNRKKNSRSDVYASMVDSYEDFRGIVLSDEYLPYMIFEEGIDVTHYVAEGVYDKDAYEYAQYYSISSKLRKIMTQAVIHYNEQSFVTKDTRIKIETHIRNGLSRDIFIDQYGNRYRMYGLKRPTERSLPLLPKEIFNSITSSFFFGGDQDYAYDCFCKYYQCYSMDYIEESFDYNK